MPTRKLPDRTRSNARSLRRNSTDAEALLWHHLRNRQLGGARFRGQHPMGGYILDFYCAEANLVIELDGGQHFEPENLQVDAQRTTYLESSGLRVIRFTNTEALLETEGVLMAIHAAVVNPSP